MENANGFSEKELAEENKDLPAPVDSFEEDSFNVTRDMESGESADRYYEIFEKSKTKSMAWSVASLTLGIASVALSFLGWVALTLGALAVILAVVSRIKLGYFDGKAIVGMMLGIFGIVFGAVMVVWKSIFSENPIASLLEKGTSGGGVNDI